MRRARFKVVAAPGERFAPGVTEGTVEILTDGNERAVFEFRPKRSRVTYPLPLEAVARHVMYHVAKARVQGGAR